MIYDVLIIGSGIIGSCVARCLSPYKLKAIVVEKETDVCEGSTKANSAIMHAGFDARPGTLKAKFNVLGNMMFRKLAKDLDINFKKNGSLVVCTGDDDLPVLHDLLRRGRANGVRQLGIIGRNELRMIEPNISENAIAALIAPESCIVCPFEFNIALAENAADNGVEFEFDSEVVSVFKSRELFHTVTSAGREYVSKVVVNAAGVHSDDIHNMICPNRISITPRRGEYLVLDRMDDYVRHTVFPTPTEMGKGILVTPTVHGNVLLGPTAEDISDKEDVKTTQEGRRKIIEGAGIIMNHLPLAKVINAFAGLRAHEDGGDFIIGENDSVKGFIDCAGVESPGLTAAPAIGAHVVELIRKMLDLKEKAFWTRKRKGITRIAGLKRREFKRLAEKDPDYAKIVCKCNKVSLGEIKDSINRTLGAVSLDGIKRRTLAFMGRCQGSFCMDDIAQILANEKKMRLSDVTKKGGRSYQFERDGHEDN